MSNGNDEHERRRGLPGQFKKFKEEMEARLDKHDHDIANLKQAINMLRVEGVARLEKGLVRLEKRFDSLREYVGRVRRALARLSPPDPGM